MIINQWEQIENKKYEYKNLRELRDNYRRPSSLSCPSCSPYEKHVYVVEIDARVKIGITANPRSRIPALQKYGEIGRVFIAPRTTSFHGPEIDLHEAFRHTREEGEFFRSSYDEVLACIRQSFNTLLKA
jgi:hypothetical protein